MIILLTADFYFKYLKRYYDLFNQELETYPVFYLLKFSWKRHY